MGIAERSRARVEELLSDLERAYDSFPVNQTTLALPAARYESARDRYSDGFVDTYVEVRNEHGETLQVPGEDGLGLPRGLPDPSDPLATDVERFVAERTGVECSIDGVSTVTIAGISNADAEDAETVYHLVVVFTARHEAGTPEGAAEWQSDVEPAAPGYV